MVKFGVEFVPADIYWKTVYYAILAEKSGFDYVWVTDHYNNRNVYVMLAAISNFTDRIKFGPGVTNPYLIHPIVTAQAAVSLNEVAQGRVVIGLGTGDKTTLDSIMAVRAKPLPSVREAVQIIRAALSGQRVEYKGEVFNVSGAKLNFKPSNPIPIFVGAQGPKMLSLASEVGDGVLINASHPDDFSKALPYIEAGLKAAGRKKEDIEIVAATSLSVAKDAEKALKAARPIVAFITAGSPAQVLEAHRIPIESAEKVRNAVMSGKWGEAFTNVTSEMMDAFAIYGTPDTCIEKIKSVVNQGVTIFISGSPIGPNVRSSIQLISEDIIPHFKAS